MSTTEIKMYTLLSNIWSKQSYGHSLKTRSLKIEEEGMVNSLGWKCLHMIGGAKAVHYTE